MLILDVKTQWASTHQMLHTLFQPSVPKFPAYRCQGERLTIVKLSTPLYHETRTSTLLNSVKLTGSLSNLLLLGSSPFDLQLQRCPPQKCRCFRQHTLFFEAYKMTSRTFSAISQTQCRPKSNLVLQMHTVSSVTITTSLMHLPSTHGLRVRGFLAS
jgi:hypothetical protein